MTQVLQRTGATRVAPSPVADTAAGAPAIPGVEMLDERMEKWNRRAVLALTVLPLTGFLTAIVTMWGWGISSVDFSIFLTFYLVSGLGVTVGYHRLFTHKSFDTGKPVKVALAVAGSMAVEGSVVSWVADHRRHHAFADKVGDPHSPHLDHEDTFKGIVVGLWHAHLGWLFSPEKSQSERWAPDLLKDPDLVKIDKRFPYIAIASFVLPALLGLVITQSIWGMITAFLWGALARIFLLHHVTWSINSICHYYGKRPFETTDKSTNNWPLALLSFGESWHNNHHAFPTSAVHGLLRGQLDMSATVIRTMARLGLVRNVKGVSDKQFEAKRAG